MFMMMNSKKQTAKPKRGNSERKSKGKRKL